MFSGYYSKGFERSDFRPIGSKEVWWITQDPAMKGLQLPLPVAGCVYLVVRGTLTSRGSYGHLGVYHRELAAQVVMEARTPSPEEVAGLSEC